MSSIQSPSQTTNEETVVPVPVRQSYNILGLSLLCISIASFVIQMELAQFVQTGIEFHKPYFILWVAHSCYIIMLPLHFMFRLNPLQYLVEFLDVGIELVGAVKPTHYSVLTTNQAVEEAGYDPMLPVTSITQILKSRHYRPVITYLLKTSLFLAVCVCIPGYVWYISLNLTTMAKVTVIYNTSCFWAYIFSIILLGESVKVEKIIAVFLSIAGVIIMTSFATNQQEHETPVIGVGDLVACFDALAYGLYQVLYKKLGSPPTPSFLFANTITGLIGVHTLFVLWIPMPILHFTGIELFELPDSGTFGYILLAAIAGVFFSASFMLVIALTSPLFAAIGIMLTIPIVALVDLLVVDTPITTNTMVGGFCILIAFVLLSWTNIKNIRDEIRKF